MILLVIQQDKTTFSSTDPEPQIIAEAIATFQLNNRKRADLDLPQLDMMTIPSSVTVATGQFPSQSTVVKRCAPPTRRKASEGMEIPDCRRIARQYYDAFRGVAEDCWTTILDDCD
ncbi:hypothetical protein AX14_002568 [Amanita brunnescens Koide BX004]|nr:hypothetical protein AX14_002568 [Amanita brunnescens Koide BX004]